ncbi:MAG: hypothetical protein K6G85_10075 [Eubacterium sp.]|nr:hypothetical protein [Eubacterium sp.]
MKKRAGLKLFGNIITGLCLGMLWILPVQAASIEIDGNFRDWNSIEKTAINSDFYQEVAFVRKDNKLYMYAKEKSKNSWETYYANTMPTLILKNGEEHVLVITQSSSNGNQSDLTIRKQNGYTEVSGAHGKRDKNGTYQYELVIPLDDFGEVDSVRFFTDYSNTQTLQLGSNENETPSVIEETTIQQETPEEIVIHSDTGKITIDGNFDDWKNYPHVFVTNWNMPEDQRNESNCRSLSIAMDDDNIYFHVKMIGGWNDPMNGNEYLLSVGDYGVSINLTMMDDRTLPQYNLSPNQYDLKVYYKNRTAPLIDNTLIPGAAAKLAVYSNGPDEVEVQVPKEIFKTVFGIDVNDVKEITLMNPNLFDHGISSTATSTMPFLGIGISVASVLLAVFLLSRKKVTHKR